MNFYRTSLITFKKLLRSLADAEVSVSAELRQKDVASSIPELSTTGLNTTQPSSSTVMALGPLGLLDRTEAGNTLSV